MGLKGRSSHPMSADEVHDLGSLHHGDDTPSDWLARRSGSGPRFRYDIICVCVSDEWKYYSTNLV